MNSRRRSGAFGRAALAVGLVVGLALGVYLTQALTPSTPVDLAPIQVDVPLTPSPSPAVPGTAQPPASPEVIQPPPPQPAPVPPPPGDDDDDDDDEDDDGGVDDG